MMNAETDLLLDNPFNSLALLKNDSENLMFLENFKCFK